jgi:cytochrome b pre-mRNA-processing protein 3
MACESCRSQARALVRMANRASHSTLSSAAVISTTGLPTMTSSVPRIRMATRAPSTRSFSSTASRDLLGGFGRSIGDSYRVIGASERLFKLCAKPAAYKISAKTRSSDTVERLEDGEEIGQPLEPNNVWHQSTSPPRLSLRSLRKQY